MALLITTDFTGKNPGLGPGLSVKNVMLYIIVMVLGFRMALVGGFRLRMPGLHVAWVVWIGYAILTWLAVSLVVKYYSYDPIASAMALKSWLIDGALFCFAAFYGVQDEDDFRVVLRGLAAVIGISSILTLTDLVGITSLGLRVGDTGAEADRVFGAFGNANETGTLLACMLPMLIAMTISSRGLWRLAGFVFTAASAAVFILTVSRGSYVGVIIGYPIAAYLLRHLLPPGRLGAWAIGLFVAAIVGAGVVAIASPHTAEAFADRVLGIGSMGLSQASSGRTDIWGLALNTMMDSPISLLTGFGWNAWSTMPTVFVLHNTYLDQWFNLGVVGLAVYVAIEYLTITTAKRAAELAMPPIRGDMMACVFGMLGLSVGVMFGNLYISRPYIWIYVGLIMREAVLLFDRAAEAAPKAVPRSVPLGTAWRRA
jgi:O-antigen ligase